MAAATIIDEAPAADPSATYATIRDEILDQKRCQFQMFSMAVTATALILAYAASAKAIPLVYLAPMVMNDFALFIILDKAISIQRKVGYLQLMEQYPSTYRWKWETQLDSFRGMVPWRGQRAADPARKHSYVTAVGVMLFLLNVLAAALSLWAIRATERPLFGSLQEAVVVLVTGGALLVFGLCYLLYQRQHLISGRHSGPSIEQTWLTVLEKHRIH